ncbi:MAG: hypothetical protein KDN18_05670, partial [Verrucomicrobiae bacterium]|nr:hypothetical protein [Verrucomicrobiae bacterium]
SGRSSNSEPGAGLRDRPKGRPIGAVSEANWREINEMAEGVGFEPTVGFPTLDFESLQKAFQGDSV